MTTALDFSPLLRSAVGFDHTADLLDRAMRFGPSDNWPPYDIEKTGENAYRITMAVAGFSADDLAIEAKENTLTVRGEKQKKDEPKTELLHQGIAARSFERRFQLADHVQVNGARLENGLLHLDLVRELPEAMKPRTIPVKAATAEPKAIEGQAQEKAAA